MACIIWLFLDFPEDASSPTSQMHGQRIIASSFQCVSKAAVKLGRHSVSMTCPQGTLFSVDLNTVRGTPLCCALHRTPNAYAHRTLVLTEHLCLLNTHTHRTPALAKHSCSLNTCTRRTLALTKHPCSLDAIMPFCTSSDLSHYFRTPCISLFTVYIRPCQQRDPYPFLFGSPARYVCV